MLAFLLTRDAQEDDAATHREWTQGQACRIGQAGRVIDIDLPVLP